MPYKFNPLSGDLDYYVAGSGDAWSDAVNANIVPDGDGTRNIGETANYFDSIFCGTLNSKNAIAVMNSSKQTEGQILATTTSPSGVSLAFGVRNASYTDNWGIFTESNASANSTNVATLYIEGGNKTAGTGDGGPIKLTPGSSVGGAYGYIWQNGVIRDTLTNYVTTATVTPSTSLFGCDGGTASFTLTLPTLGTDVYSGTRLRFVNNEPAGIDLTLAPAGTDTIATAANNYCLGELGDHVELVADTSNANWIVTSGNTRQLVYARGNAGGTASTTASIVFDEEVTDIEATWSGSVFTAPRPGIYTISGFTRWAAAISALRAYLGGSADDYVGYNGDSTTIMSFYWSGHLAAGGTWQLRPTTTAANSDTSDSTHHIRIQEVR